ncbi:MAG TPA: disulfide oxidoreductase [Solirubrobacteraceae bacterium]|nr:disulfide oxidoreductase [Solirubrobacteraceae bacterium]
MTNAVSTGLATLAILLQAVLAIIALLALASLFWEAPRRILVEVRETMLGGELWAAWAVALASMLGSLYFSQIANFVPCELCWFQRIAMYPLVVILLVGALKRDARTAVQYAFVLPIVGFLISTYHIYIEANPSAEPSGCRVGGTSCATKWIEKFGYVTIPVLAITAFATILTLLAFAWSRRTREAVR